MVGGNRLGRSSWIHRGGRKPPGPELVQHAGGVLRERGGDPEAAVPLHELAHEPLQPIELLVRHEPDPAHEEERAPGEPDLPRLEPAVVVERGREAIVRDQVHELRDDLRPEPDELLLDLPRREPARPRLLGDRGPPLHVQILVQREPDPHPLAAWRAVHAAAERGRGRLVPVPLDGGDRVQAHEPPAEEGGRGVLAENVHGEERTLRAAAEEPGPVDRLERPHEPLVERGVERRAPGPRVGDGEAADALREVVVGPLARRPPQEASARLAAEPPVHLRPLVRAPGEPLLGVRRGAHPGEAGRAARDEREPVERLGADPPPQVLHGFRGAAREVAPERGEFEVGVHEGRRYNTRELTPRSGSPPARRSPASRARRG